MIEPAHENDPFPDGNIRIVDSEDHKSWIYTRNIVYDTFRVVKVNPNVIASFNKNLYYNPYDTQLLSGAQQTSFAQWQSTGQDNGSTLLIHYLLVMLVNAISLQ